MSRRKFGSYVRPPRPSKAEREASRRLQFADAPNPAGDAVRKALMFDPPSLGNQEIIDGMAGADPIDED